jgi:predicted nucleic acid-binding protein
MIPLPTGPLLFDTAIYIRSIRGEKYEWLTEDDRLFPRTIFTAVVAAEFYSGTRSRIEKQSLDRLCVAHELVGHFSYPAADTWIQTGILMRRARAVFGALSFAHHFRDALIALEAARWGATLVSENAADFTRWKALLASAGPNLKVFYPS